MASTPDALYLETIELVLKELESLWVNARSTHLYDPENTFNTGRYEGLTQAIAVVENMVAHGKGKKT